VILESSEKDQLYTALAQAQVEFPTIRVNRKAFKNEYADLYAILKPVYPIMNKYGLSIRPWAGIIEGVQYIGARLMHKSGQYETNIFKFESDPCKNPNDQASHKKQGALTYFNRNHIKDMLGVLISDDPEDDDGQGHMESKESHQTHHSECINKEQLEILEHTLAGDIEIAKKIISGFNIPNLAAIPKDKFLITMSRVKSLKAEYDKLKNS